MNVKSFFPEIISVQSTSFSRHKSLFEYRPQKENTRSPSLEKGDIFYRVLREVSSPRPPFAS